MPLNSYTRPNKSVLAPELATAFEGKGLCMVCHDAKVQRNEGSGKVSFSYLIMKKVCNF